MKLRERERERMKKIFFALKIVQNAPFENEVFVDGEKIKRSLYRWGMGVKC